MRVSRSHIRLLIVISLSVSISCNPSDSPAERDTPLSLDAAVNEALRSNPEILAAKKNYEAAKARVPQELTPEDPMLEYGYDEMRAGVPGVMGKPMRSYSVSQKAPFPTKLFLRSSIAAKDARILYENWKEKERDIIAKTKKSYFELWNIEKSIGITKENEALLEQLASSAGARYAVAKANQQDVLKTQVELAKIKSSLVLLDQRRQIAQADLNILMNRNPRANVEIDKDLESRAVKVTLDELSDMAKAGRPRLRAFKYAVEKGREAYLLAWNEFLPDFSVRYEQMIVDGRGEEWSGMLGLSVPIWFWTKQAQGVTEMKSELEMFRAEYNTMENMALFDVKDSYARVESRKTLVEIYETSFIPQAEQAFKASLAGYEAGQVDFLDLLDSQRMLLEIKLDYYMTVAQLEAAKADLEKAVGRDL